VQQDLIGFETVPEFMEALYDRIKAANGLKHDKDIRNLFPDPKPHWVTLSTWKSGKLDLDVLATLLGFLKPPLALAQCLLFPDMVGKMRAFQIEWQNRDRADQLLLRKSKKAGDPKG
jgi:hypothetical protein